MYKIITNLDHPLIFLIQLTKSSAELHISGLCNPSLNLSFDFDIGYHKTTTTFINMT